MQYDEIDAKSYHGSDGWVKDVDYITESIINCFICDPSLPNSFFPETEDTSSVKKGKRGKRKKNWGIYVAKRLRSFWKNTKIAKPKKPYFYRVVKDVNQNVSVKFQMMTMLIFLKRFGILTITQTARFSWIQHHDNGSAKM